MSELFLNPHVAKLLNNKFVVIIGSSVQRSMYKDLVKILKKDNYLNDKELRAKGEFKFENDDLIEGGRKNIMTNNNSYREVREYKTDYHLIRFYFVTRCYNKYMETVINGLKQEPHPDVLILNSCLWDITRYGLGTESVEAYRKNLHMLLKHLKLVLPTGCLVIWNSTLPVDKEAKGGLFVPEVESAKTQLGVKILACNLIAHHIVKQYNYDYIDLHYFLRYHLHRRAEDGVHWDMTAHRRMTNLILCQIAEAWDAEKPQSGVSQGTTVEVGKPTTNTAKPAQPLMVVNLAANIPQPSDAGQKKNHKRKVRSNRNFAMKYNYNQEQDFTQDTYFEDAYDGNYDENYNPNQYNYQNNPELYNQPEQFQQFEWQEYSQSNLQGFCSFNNINRNRHQPYSHNYMHRGARYQH